MHTAQTPAFESILHQSQQPANTPWAWTLAPQQATTLAAAAALRWLHVDSGCVWATRRDGSAQASDIWLAAGDSLALPAGSAWVLEGWPQARLSLLLQAPVPVSQPAAAWLSRSSAFSRLAALARALLRRRRAGWHAPAA